MEVGADELEGVRPELVVGGLVLAAGEGRRMGGPKALLRLTSGAKTMIENAISVVRQGGCHDVTVVVGAAAERVGGLAEAMGAAVVVETGWAEGMGASLRAGLAAVEPDGSVAVLVSLVDLPDVGPEVVRRIVAAAGSAPADALVRAAYRGVEGHPVLIGRNHWHGVAELARGDIGAREYLATHEVTVVECGDIATGRDLDRPADVWREEWSSRRG